MPKGDNLTVKQKAFADEYLKNGGNATGAARKAGYKNPNVQGTENLAKSSIYSYIASKQKQIDKQNGHDIMSLAEIQAFRAKVVKGEVKDGLGFDPDISDRLKAANDLEKAIKIKEEKEEQLAREEAARNQCQYHTDLDIVADTFHSVVRDIRNKKHREYVLEGGRGSTKSSVGTEIPFELMMNNPNIHCLALRQVANTLRDSIYAQFKWSADKQNENPMFNIENWDFKLSPLEITYKPTGQKIYFRGADDPGKIKSIKVPFGYIGILIFEELDQFKGEEEVRKIEQSAIRGGDDATILKFFNPPKSANNWVNKYTKIPKATMLVHKSTYKDVPEEWLGQPFIDEAEHLKRVNPTAYEHEYMGVSNGNGGMVFENLELRTITDKEVETFDRIYQGVDYGWYPDHYSFGRFYYNHNTETIYIIDENYVNKQSNAITGQWILDKNYTDYSIICDSAEPKSINDYVDMHIPARPAIKGPGSIEYGMKWLQGKKIVIDHERTPNAFKEITEYEYEKDKDGNDISGYPDLNNHFIDCMRYAFEPLWSRRGSSA